MYKKVFYKVQCYIESSSKQTFSYTQPIRYVHYITYDGVKYIRSEVQSLNHFKLGGEIKDLHTISWHLEEEFINPMIEYYTNDRGWIKKGDLGESNTPPELEKIFKETIGKDLFYFEH